LVIIGLVVILIGNEFSKLAPIGHLQSYHIRFLVDICYIIRTPTSSSELLLV